MDSVDYFSATMLEADKKFLDLGTRRGAKISLFPHPKRGPHGEPLQTIVARIGAEDAADVLVVISATHGIEGYCGAGIQTGLLDVLPSLSIPDSLAIVVVHMINPWGCAWDKRENEDNIDIFRNLLYCYPPYQANPAYDLLADAICPAEWAGPLRDAAERAIASYDAEYGEGSVIGVARRGQHDHPKGLTYHGKGPSWSKHTIDAVVAQELQHAERILNLDLHTGYGDYGAGVVVSFEPPESRTATRLARWFGSDLLFPGSDPIIPAHPGSPYDVVCRGLNADVTSYALEFGTAHVAALFDLLREASWVFNYGDPLSQQGRDVRARYRELFYPENDDWKRAVWNRGLQVFEQSVAAIRNPGFD